MISVILLGYILLQANAPIWCWVLLGIKTFTIALEFGIKIAKAAMGG